MSWPRSGPCIYCGEHVVPGNCIGIGTRDAAHPDCYAKQCHHDNIVLAWQVGIPSVLFVALLGFCVIRGLLS
jgi:hypothetical protein